MDEPEKYELFLRVADGEEECLYLIEHWFAEQPDATTITSLFADAKYTFATLYPDAEAEDFSVEVRRLRPIQVRGPEFPERLGDPT